MVGLDARIKDLRNSRKMTQNELAKKLGIAKATVSSYENGTRLPSYDILVRMARLFSVTIDSLLGNGDKDTIDVTGLTNEQISSLNEIANAYRKLNKVWALTPDEIKQQIE